MISGFFFFGLALVGLCAESSLPSLGQKGIFLCFHLAALQFQFLRSGLWTILDYFFCILWGTHFISTNLQLFQHRLFKRLYFVYWIIFVPFLEISWSFMSIHISQFFFLVPWFIHLLYQYFVFLITAFL